MDKGTSMAPSALDDLVELKYQSRVELDTRAELGEVRDEKLGGCAGRGEVLPGWVR